MPIKSRSDYSTPTVGATHVNRVAMMVSQPWVERSVTHGSRTHTNRTALAVAGFQPWVQPTGGRIPTVGANPHESRSDDGIPAVGDNPWVSR